MRGDPCNENANGLLRVDGRCDSVKALTQKNENDVRKTAARLHEQTSTAATTNQTARCVATRRSCCPMGDRAWLDLRIHI